MFQQTITVTLQSEKTWVKDKEMSKKQLGQQHSNQTGSEDTDNEQTSNTSNQTLWIGIGVTIGVILVIVIVTWAVRRYKHMQPFSKESINDENITRLLKDKNISETLKNLL